MKYLKKFNESNDIYPVDTYYKVIDGYEVKKIMFDKKEYFNDKEVDTIKKYLNGNQIELEYNLKRLIKDIVIKITNNHNSDHYSPIRLYIDKIVDEWYVIEEYKMGDTQPKFYLCDQFDGLIKFLKDKL